MAITANSCRPFISLVDGEVFHNGQKCRVVLRRGKISVGCTDVTPDALRHLLAKYDDHFADEVVVLQP